jgi:hypothetical protein
MASWLRDRLADEAGGLATLAALLAEARGRLRADGRSTEEVDWGALLDGPLPSLIDAGRLEQARALVTAATGVDLA